MSTASSLGGTRPSALGSICSTAGSLAPVPEPTGEAAQGQAAAEEWRPAADDWEPAEEGQASGGGESDNDWELEFMFRAGIDAYCEPVEPFGAPAMCPASSGARSECEHPEEAEDFF